MATLSKKSLKNYISSNWVLEPDKEYFTHDDLIDAYLIGREEQKDQMQKVLIEKMEENIKKAQGIVEKITEETISKGFKIFKSYLIIEDIFKYNAIFDVSIEDFTSDNFDEMYTYSSDLKKEVNDDTFIIDFTFMPHTENLDENIIACDGILLIHQKSG